MNTPVISSGSREPFFFCAELPPTPAGVTLAGDEGRHALSVRRLRSGDAITLFDGRGGIGSGQVIDVDARRKTLEVRIESIASKPAPRPVTLAAALPKGERLAVMLDMATQLGITRFVPLDCERSVVRVSDNARKRWQRICLEACKQSRRAWLPELAAPATIAQLLKDSRQAVQLWIADPDGDAAVDQARAWAASGEELIVMVGPEGGFTDAERQSVLGAGGRAVALGHNILRVETAAAAALSCIAAAI